MKYYRNLKLFFFLLVSLYFNPCHGDTPEAPYLTIIGNINMADGLGRLSAELVKTFKDELSIGFVHTREPVFRDVPREIISLVRQKKPLGNVILLEDLIWCPQAKTYDLVLPQKTDDQILIAYSLFESDQIATEWVTRLNTDFDAVAVADNYLAGVYQNCGVTIPIFVLPLGLHLEDYLNQPLKTHVNNSVFTFGALGFGQERKNLIKLVKGFALAFKNNPQVKLRINCRGAHYFIRDGIRNEIRNQGLKNVEYTELNLRKDLYIELFKTLDCLVSISTGEGFAIQPREAMALGIPVIVTNNTAQKTICDSLLVREVPSTIPYPAYYMWINRNLGHFFDCKEEDVAAALKDVYTHYDRYLQMSAQSRDWASYYHYPNLVSLYRGLIKPATIELGDENRLEPNKMITTSRKLYEKFLKILSP